MHKRGSILKPAELIEEATGSPPRQRHLLSILTGEATLLNLNCRLHGSTISTSSIGHLWETEDLVTLHHSSGTLGVVVVPFYLSREQSL